MGTVSRAAETFLLSRCKLLGAPRYHHPVVYVSVKLWGRDPVRGSRSAKTTGSSIQHSRFQDHQESDGRQDATALRGWRDGREETTKSDVRSQFSFTQEEQSSKSVDFTRRSNVKANFP